MIAPTGSPTAVLPDGTEDEPYTVTAAQLLAGFTDAEDDALHVANLAASNGTVTDNGDGTYSITPTADFNGAVTLTYDVTDGNGGVLPGQTQTYTLDPVNDAPVLAGINQGTGIYSENEDPIAITDIALAGGIGSAAFIGSDFLVNTTTVGFQSAPSIAGLRGGGFVVTYSSGSVFGQVFDANGLSVADEFLLGSGVDSTVTAVAGGGYALVWNDRSFGTSGTLHGQVFDADGQNVTSGGEFALAEFGNDAAELSLAGLENGNFVVVWTDVNGVFSGATGVDYESSGIVARLIAANGQAVGSEFVVNTTTVGAQYEPSVSGLEGGGFVVVWTDGSQTGNDTSGSAIRGSVNAIGGYEEFLVNTTTAGNQSDASVTALVGGGFVVVWQDASQTGDDTSGSAVRGQIFNAHGQAVGSEFLVNTTTAGNQSDPSVTSLAGGEFVVTWEDASQTGDDTSGSAIRGQAFSATGQTVGSEFLVNTTTAGNQSDPSVTSLAGGGVAVAWEDATGVRAQIFDDPPSLTITDVDDTNIESATVAITSGFVPGEDVLGFSDQNGITGNSSYDPDTGILTLTLTGSASLAAYEAAFKSVTYENTSDDPSAGTRTLSFTVNDGDLDSNTVTRQINVIPVADAPIAQDDAVTTDEDSMLSGNVLVDNGHGADSDVDGDTLTVTQVNGLGGNVGSEITLASGALLTLNADGTFHYDPNGQFEDLGVGERGTDMFRYTVSDGTTTADFGQVVTAFSETFDDASQFTITLGSFFSDGRLSYFGLYDGAGGGDFGSDPVPPLGDAVLFRVRWKLSGGTRPGRAHCTPAHMDRD